MGMFFTVKIEPITPASCEIAIEAISMTSFLGPGFTEIIIYQKFSWRYFRTPLQLSSPSLGMRMYCLSELRLSVRTLSVVNE